MATARLARGPAVVEIKEFVSSYVHDVNYNGTPAARLAVVVVRFF